MCANSEGVEQLDVYPQIQFLYDYFDNCVFKEKHLEKGKTYILPIDVEIDLFEIPDYEEFTDPNYEFYEPLYTRISDMAPFVESHNKHIHDEWVGVTLNKGTRFIFDGEDGHGSITLLVDGYPLDLYGYLISEDGDEGLVPYVIKA
jgi:hypothetical protein